MNLSLCCVWVEIIVKFPRKSGIFPKLQPENILEAYDEKGSVFIKRFLVSSRSDKGILVTRVSGRDVVYVRQYVASPYLQFVSISSLRWDQYDVFKRFEDLQNTETGGTVKKLQ